MSKRLGISLRLLEILASITGVYCAFGPFSIVKKIIRRKSIHGIDTDFTSFIQLFLNSVTWFIYGLATNNIFPMVVTNGFGTFLSIWYIFIYYFYARYPSEKIIRKENNQQIAMALSFAILMGLYPITSHDPIAKIEKNLGFISLLSAILTLIPQISYIYSKLFHSEVTPLNKKNKSKSLSKNSIQSLPTNTKETKLDNLYENHTINDKKLSSSIHFLYFDWLCSFLWFLYGFVDHDYYVITPNFFSCIVSTLEIYIEKKESDLSILPI